LRVPQPEHAVLHVNGRQLAGPHAQHRELRHLRRTDVQHKVVRLDVKLEQPQMRREQVAFGPVRSHHELERQPGVPLHHPVRSAILLVRQAGRKLSGRFNRLQRDRAIDQPRSKHTVTLPAQDLDQIVQRRAGQIEPTTHFRCDRHARSFLKSRHPRLDSTLSAPRYPI